MKPIPIILSGPSGVGKNTIARALLKQFPQIRKIKTITTRPKRGDHDNDYVFVSDKEFRNMIDNQEFWEWTQVHDNFYGSRKSDVQTIIQQHKYPLLLIDVAGAAIYRQNFHSVLDIFIQYESLSELPERLRKTRPNITESEIVRRLATAKQEMKEKKRFKYVVKNKKGKLNKTVDQVINIIEHELKLKTNQ